jgi:hypothetical protein
MPWGRLEDTLYDNDKLADVSDAAYRLYVQAISWCNRTMSDGHVPLSRPARLVSLRNPKKTIDELLTARLWHRASSPCRKCVDERERKKADARPSSGYVIHDYFEFNKARWVIEAERAELRERGRRGGQASGMARSGALKPPASETEGADEAVRSSHGSSGPVKPPASPHRFTTPLHPAASPRTPYSRSPVPRSDSEGPQQQRDEPDEPPIPDAPQGPDRSRSRGTTRTTGLRHISQAMGGTR